MKRKKPVRRPPNPDRSSTTAGRTLRKTAPSLRVNKLRRIYRRKPTGTRATALAAAVNKTVGDSSLLAGTKRKRGRPSRGESSRRQGVANQAEESVPQEEDNQDEALRNQRVDRLLKQLQIDFTESKVIRSRRFPISANVVVKRKGRKNSKEGKGTVSQASTSAQVKGKTRGRTKLDPNTSSETSSDTLKTEIRIGARSKNRKSGEGQPEDTSLKEVDFQSRRSTSRSRLSQQIKSSVDKHSESMLPRETRKESRRDSTSTDSSTAKGKARRGRSHTENTAEPMETEEKPESSKQTESAQSAGATSREIPSEPIAKALRRGVGSRAAYRGRGVTARASYRGRGRGVVARAAYRGRGRGRGRSRIIPGQRSSGDHITSTEQDAGTSETDSQLEVPDSKQDVNRVAGRGRPRKKSPARSEKGDATDIEVLPKAQSSVKKENKESDSNSGNRGKTKKVAQPSEKIETAVDIQDKVAEPEVVEDGKDSSVGVLQSEAKTDGLSSSLSYHSKERSSSVGSFVQYRFSEFDKIKRAGHSRSSSPGGTAVRVKKKNVSIPTLDITRSSSLDNLLYKANTRSGTTQRKVTSTCKDGAEGVGVEDSASNSFMETDSVEDCASNNSVKSESGVPSSHPSKPSTSLISKGFYGTKKRKQMTRNPNDGPVVKKKRLLHRLRDADTLRMPEIMPRGRMREVVWKTPAVIKMKSPGTDLKVRDDAAGGTPDATPVIKDTGNVFENIANFSQTDKNSLKQTTSFSGSKESSYQTDGELSKDTKDQNLSSAHSAGPSSAADSAVQPSFAVLPLTPDLAKASVSSLISDTSPSVSEKTSGRSQVKPDILPTKRGPGRPKGSLNKTTLFRMQLNMVQNRSSGSFKRGPGRPKKGNISESSNTFASKRTASFPAPPLERKSGRSSQEDKLHLRKQFQFNTSRRALKAKSAISSAIIKRGPGRPKKNPKTSRKPQKAQHVVEVLGSSTEDQLHDRLPSGSKSLTQQELINNREQEAITMNESETKLQVSDMDVSGLDSIVQLPQSQETVTSASDSQTSVFSQLSSAAESIAKQSSLTAGNSRDTDNVPVSRRAPQMTAVTRKAGQKFPHRTGRRKLKKSRWASGRLPKQSLTAIGKIDRATIQSSISAYFSPEPYIIKHKPTVKHAVQKSTADEQLPSLSGRESSDSNNSIPSEEPDNSQTQTVAQTSLLDNEQTPTTSDSAQPSFEQPQAVPSSDQTEAGKSSTSVLAENPETDNTDTVEGLPKMHDTGEPHGISNKQSSDVDHSKVFAFPDLSEVIPSETGQSQVARIAEKKISDIARRKHKAVSRELKRLQTDEGAQKIRSWREKKKLQSFGFMLRSKLKDDKKKSQLKSPKTVVKRETKQKSGKLYSIDTISETKLLLKSDKTADQLGIPEHTKGNEEVTVGANLNEDFTAKCEQTQVSKPKRGILSMSSSLDSEDGLPPNITEVAPFKDNRSDRSRSEELSPPPLMRPEDPYSEEYFVSMPVTASSSKSKVSETAFGEEVSDDVGTLVYIQAADSGIKANTDFVADIDVPQSTETSGVHTAFILQEPRGQGLKRKRGRPVKRRRSKMGPASKTGREPHVKPGPASSKPGRKPSAALKLDPTYIHNTPHLPSEPRTFALRPKTTRSPIEILALRRKQEEEEYELEEATRLARKLKRRQTHFSKPSIACDSVSQQLLGDCRQCSVVLVDFVKKLHLNDPSDHYVSDVSYDSDEKDLDDDDAVDYTDADYDPEPDEADVIEEEKQELAAEKAYIKNMTQKRNADTPRVPVTVDAQKAQKEKAEPAMDSTSLKTPVQSVLEVKKTGPDLDSLRGKGFLGDFVDFIQNRDKQDATPRPKQRNTYRASTATTLSTKSASTVSVSTVSTSAIPASVISATTASAATVSNSTSSASTFSASTTSTSVVSASAVTISVSASSCSSVQLSGDLPLTTTAVSVVSSVMTSSSSAHQTVTTAQVHTADPSNTVHTADPINTVNRDDEKNVFLETETVSSSPSKHSEFQDDISFDDKIVSSSPTKAVESFRDVNMEKIQSGPLSPTLAKSQPDKGQSPGKLKVFPTRKENENGATEKTATTRFLCTKCDFSATNKETIESHVYRHIPGVNFKCGYCDSEFTGLVSALTHVKNSHNNKEPKVWISKDINEASLYSEEAILPSELGQPEPQQQKPGLPNPAAIASQICEAPAVQETQPVIISLVVSGDMPVQRQERFSSSPLATQRRFACTHCSYSTNVVDDAKQHVRDLHEGNTIYTCYLCDKAFGCSLQEVMAHCEATHPHRQNAFKKLPDFYDQELLRASSSSSSDRSKPAEDRGNIFDRMSSLFPNLGPGGEVLDDGQLTPQARFLRARDYLYIKEGWSKKTSAEADSTTVEDIEIPIEETAEAEATGLVSTTEELASDQQSEEKIDKSNVGSTKDNQSLNLDSDSAQSSKGAISAETSVNADTADSVKGDHLEAISVTQTSADAQSCERFEEKDQLKTLDGQRSSGVGMAETSGHTESSTGPECLISLETGASVAETTGQHLTDDNDAGLSTVSREDDKSSQNVSDMLDASSEHDQETSIGDDINKESSMLSGSDQDTSSETSDRTAAKDQTEITSLNQNQSAAETEVFSSQSPDTALPDAANETKDTDSSTAQQSSGKTSSWAAEVEEVTDSTGKAESRTETSPTDVVASEEPQPGPGEADVEADNDGEADDDGEADGDILVINLDDDVMEDATDDRSSTPEEEKAESLPMEAGAEGSDMSTTNTGDDDSGIGIKILSVVSLRDKANAIPGVSHSPTKSTHFPRTDSTPTSSPIPSDVTPTTPLPSPTVSSTPEPSPSVSSGKKSSSTLAKNLPEVDADDMAVRNEKMVCTYKCHACNVHSPALAAIVEHLKQYHHDVPLFSCPYCKNKKDSFYTEEKVHMHVIDVHPSNYAKNEVSLSEMAKSFVQVLALPSGRTSKGGLIEQDIYMCLQCDSHVPDTDYAVRHLKLEHPDLLKYACPSCGTFSNSSEDVVKRHMCEMHGHALDSVQLPLAMERVFLTKVTSISQNGRYSNQSPATPTKTSPLKASPAKSTAPPPEPNINTAAAVGIPLVNPTELQAVPVAAVENTGLLASSPMGPLGLVQVNQVSPLLLAPMQNLVPAEDQDQTATASSRKPRMSKQRGSSLMPISSLSSKGSATQMPRPILPMPGASSELLRKGAEFQKTGVTVKDILDTRQRSADDSPAVSDSAPAQRVTNADSVQSSSVSPSPGPSSALLVNTSPSATPSDTPSPRSIFSMTDRLDRLGRSRRSVSPHGPSTSPVTTSATAMGSPSRPVLRVPHVSSLLNLTSPTRSASLSVDTGTSVNTLPAGASSATTPLSSRSPGKSLPMSLPLPVATLPVAPMPVAPFPVSSLPFSIAALTAHVTTVSSHTNQASSVSSHTSQATISMPASLQDREDPEAFQIFNLKPRTPITHSPRPAGTPTVSTPMTSHSPLLSAGPRLVQPASLTAGAVTMASSLFPQQFRVQPLPALQPADISTLPLGQGGLSLAQNIALPIGAGLPLNQGGIAVPIGVSQAQLLMAQNPMAPLLVPANFLSQLTGTGHLRGPLPQPQPVSVPPQAPAAHQQSLTGTQPVAVNLSLIQQDAAAASITGAQLGSPRVNQPSAPSTPITSSHTSFQPRVTPSRGRGRPRLHQNSNSPTVQRVPQQSPSLRHPVSPSQSAQQQPRHSSPAAAPVTRPQRHSSSHQYTCPYCPQTLKPWEVKHHINIHHPGKEVQYNKKV